MRVIQFWLSEFSLRSDRNFLTRIADGSLLSQSGLIILLFISLKLLRKWLLLLVKFLKKFLILNNRSRLPLILLLLRRLLSNNLGGGDAREIIQRPGLEPAVRDVQLPLDLLPHAVHFINGENELCADGSIVILSKDPALILTKIIPVKAIFKCERMSNLKLLPCDHASRSNFKWLNPKSTIPIVEHMRLLSKYSRQQSDNGPAEEAAISCCVATVEK